MRLLLENGANPDCNNEFRETPLINFCIRFDAHFRMKDKTTSEAELCDSFLAVLNTFLIYLPSPLSLDREGRAAKEILDEKMKLAPRVTKKYVGQERYVGLLAALTQRLLAYEGEYKAHKEKCMELLLSHQIPSPLAAMVLSYAMPT